jgi:hypothetical protein
MAEQNRQPLLRVTGSPQVVFDWSRDACSAEEIPDLPVRAFRDDSGRTQIILAHYVNRRLVGKDLAHLRGDCRPVLSSAASADPAMFSDRRWLASLYTLDGRTVYALVHDEYQGHRHAGRCRSGQYEPCWYNAVTLAVSNDGGDVYRQAPSPRHLIASIPQRYRPDDGPAGMFAPSNIVRSPRDGFYYVLVRMIGYGGSPRGTCVLRAPRLDRADAWRAWDGAEFSIRLRDPYGKHPSRARFCVPVAKNEIAEMDESLTYNAVLGGFLLVGLTSAYDQQKRTIVDGVYYSSSDNLISWTPRRLLFEAERVQTYHCGDADPIAYPSVIDPSSRSRSFDTSDANAYLYFTRLNYDGCQQTRDRDLLRVPIAVGEQP